MLTCYNKTGTGLKKYQFQDVFDLDLLFVAHWLHFLSAHARLYYDCQDKLTLGSLFHTFSQLKFCMLTLKAPC